MAVLILLLVASGCQPAPTGASPTGEPALITPAAAQILQVDLTPALRHLVPLLTECTRQQETLGLVVNELSTVEADRRDGAMRLRWGAPTSAPGFAAALAQERLAVVVHPDNPLASLTHAQLRAIYSGSARRWGDLPDCAGCAAGALAAQEIRAWAYAPGEDIQQVFEAALGQRVQPAAAGQAPHPSAVLQAVAADSAAIGLIPARLVSSDARAVSITGIPEEALTRPILALTPAEPRGLEREWLACLQEKLRK